MSDRAVKKLVEKYKKQAGITKQISSLKASSAGCLIKCHIGYI